jgi:peptidoglycan/xylan/chitin deacetylase (PgdA/CDA1 family)
VSILLYHDPDPARFAEQLRYLAERYTLIPLGVLIAALESGDWDQLPDRALVITLDDGWERNHSLRAALAEAGARPTVYLCSAALGSDRTLWFDGLPPAEVERLKSLPDSERRAELARREPPSAGTGSGRRTLSAEQARELAEVWDVGSHGREHATLPRSCTAVAEEEILRSRTELEELVGRRCLDFAYPAGAYGRREVELTQAAGYRSARTVDVGWNGPGADPFRLKILSIDPPTVTRLAADLSGLKWLARLVAGKGRLDGRRRLRSPRLSGAQASTDGV